MMATEATPENFVDTPTKSPLEQTTTSHDAATSEPHVNGSVEDDDNKLESEPADSTAISAEVSVNGGSDTEATKAEVSKGQLDEKGHTRSASTVKKPTMFKAVSVNKTFLAAKGATGATPAKLGDKAAAGSNLQPLAPLASAASRPRLVAKTGSGLRDSAPRTSTALNGGAGGVAPDASAVWNKNRPAPPQEQKRISDEELKQQFGIHLATRLQSDDPGKQANWADIDDDDDDWAPESIQWTDGTKISLPQHSDEPPPVQVPTIVDVVVSKPSSPAPPMPSSTLKLGGISGGSGRGLILKGAAEKPTLVAKPPGPPTPVKSPWASLPPVEKAVPIAIELSTQQQQTRFTQRDPHGFDALPPPAKEIAADDFSRSWREGNNNSNRELYNSQSGRYEPVNDNRRASTRAENYPRQPALLQRPSHYDQQGPAEPSAAFQTHRAAGHEASYGRRRTSSNVSGGSGNFARRMSRGQETYPPHDLPNFRRGSLAAVSDSPSSPTLQSSSGHQQDPRQQQPQQWQLRESPSMSHTSPASVYGQMAQAGGPAIPTESEVELQARVMKEGREHARKRRLEEEAKEEAARKERIRLKLEAMGPAPESKKTKKETTQSERVIPTQIQTREVSATITSPPKPPVPEVAGEVRQYGMMKVHHPEPISHASELPSPAETARLNGVQVPHPIHEPVPETHSSPLPMQDSKQSPSWQTAPPIGLERFNSWASPAPQQTQDRNVWGPPTNGRTLGNGTFNPELSRVPEMQSSQMNAGPGPIGPPNSNRNQGQYSGRGRDQYERRPQPIAPPRRQYQQNLSQQDQQARHSAWLGAPDKIRQEDTISREEYDKDATQRELGANTEPSGPVFKNTYREVILGEDGKRSAVTAVTRESIALSSAQSWKTSPIELGQAEAVDSSRLEQQNISKLDAPGGVYNTWRQIPTENGVRSEAIGTSVSVTGGSATSNASPPVRGSRFFPQSKDVRLEETATIFARPGSPSPPPPTMAGHPAYDGDSLRPHVVFPRPPPVVRLPPATVLAPIGPPKPITSFAAAAAAPVVPPAPLTGPSSYPSRHHANDTRISQGQGAGVGVWQDRINSLIGRKPSPPKAHVLAVNSSSRHALELPPNLLSATVSLPTNASTIILIDDGTYETKPMAEECFEEQEMGSLPVVQVPGAAPEAAWNMAPPQGKSLPRKFVVSHITSSETIPFLPESGNSGDKFLIKFPGMEEEIYITVPRKAEPRQKSNPRRGGQSRGGSQRHASSGQSRGGRTRDVSSSFASPTVEHTSTSAHTTSARGSSRSRGYGSSNWSSHRHVSTPPNAINV